MNALSPIWYSTDSGERSPLNGTSVSTPSQGPGNITEENEFKNWGMGTTVMKQPSRQGPALSQEHTAAMNIFTRLPLQLFIMDTGNSDAHPCLPQE